MRLGSWPEDDAHLLVHGNCITIGAEHRVVRDVGGVDVDGLLVNTFGQIVELPNPTAICLVVAAQVGWGGAGVQRSTKEA